MTTTTTPDRTETVVEASYLADGYGNSSYTVTQVVTHRETYQDVTIELVETTQGEHTQSYGNGTSRQVSAWVSQSVAIDGRVVRRGAGTDEQVLAKLRKTIDRWAEDETMLSDLTSLVGRRVPVEGATTVGSIAAVYAMGRNRTGRVISETRTGYVVAYTTASSNGRVYRKRVAK